MAGRKDVSCGVPQGSLLGSRIFKRYINDVADRAFYMYADDTTAYHVGDNIDEVKNDLDEITR